MTGDAPPRCSTRPRSTSFYCPKRLRYSAESRKALTISAVTARAAGGTPEWARERVESLRKKAEKPARDAQPAAVKN